MLVERFTFVLKPGKIGEFTALAKETLLQAGFTDARVYKIQYGTTDRVVLDFEYESIEERERLVNEWSTAAEATAWSEKSNAMRESAATHEIWTLVE